MTVPRAVHTATTLLDGRVLVAGGCTTAGCGDVSAGRRADIYLPNARAFVTGPPMMTARAGHTATRLPDGRVLITGGYAGEGSAPLRSAELFDPAKNRFVATGDMAVGRGAHTATLLPDGRVLVVGGWTGSSARTEVEFYDPSTGVFLGAAPLPGPRANHAATLLRDGLVLAVGGQSDLTTLLDTAVLYDPAQDIWRDAGRLGVAKFKLALAPLADGGALVVGGQTRDDFRARLATTELYDATTRRFASGPTMAEPRFKLSDALVPLADGRVVVAGGGRTVEVFSSGQIMALAGNLGGIRLFPAAAALHDGTVLITGGYDDRIQVTDNALLARPG